MCLICVCSSFFFSFLIIKRIKYIYNKKCSTIKEKVNLLIDGFENCLTCERSSRFIPLQMQLGRLLSFLFQRNESKKIAKFEPSLSPVSSWERFNEKSQFILRLPNIIRISVAHNLEQISQFSQREYPQSALLSLDTTFSYCGSEKVERSWHFDETFIWLTYNFSLSLSLFGRV